MLYNGSVMTKICGIMANCVMTNMWYNDCVITNINGIMVNCVVCGIMTNLYDIKANLHVTTK